MRCEDHVVLKFLFPYWRLCIKTTVGCAQAERAYLALRHDVVRGRLAPGQRLRLEHLKDQYQVGSGTLREALSLLVSDALMTVEGQRGFRVAPMAIEDLEDLTRLRLHIKIDALRRSIRCAAAPSGAAACSRPTTRDRPSSSPSCSTTASAGSS